MNYFFTFCFALFFLTSFSQQNEFPSLSINVKQQLQTLSDLRTQSEKSDNLKTFLSCYDENAISMPEYQPTLQGINEIEAYYKEIFHRQNIKTFERKAEEFIHLDKTIIEIGIFTKEYTDANVDTIVTQNGKYWNVWAVKPDGSIKLKGEAFGYFHPVINPADLVVQLPKQQQQQSWMPLDPEIPFELKAYNALMEKGVRERNGTLRSEFFTKDGRFMPFQEPTVTGIDKIKPYLIAYSSRGIVTIDSIFVSTYHCEYFDDYVLEYSMFRVKWTIAQNSGRTEGKGIRVWKRQADKSLKLYREIGTHNHLE